MKINYSRQPVVAAAIVAAVAFSVWYGLDRPASQELSPTAPIAESAAVPAPVSDPASADVSVEETVVTPPQADGTKLVFSKPKNVTGETIDLNGPAYQYEGMTGQLVHGRVGDLDLASFASLNDLNEGDAVSFPGFNGELHGVVEVALLDEDGVHRVGGPLDGDRKKGWFSFAYDGNAAHGLVRLNTEKLAYEIVQSASGGLQMVERPLADMVCLSLPTFTDAALAVPGGNTGRAAAAPPIVTPILNSRPAAAAVIFMDFDGDNVNDPEWGRINAPASPLTAVQRADVFRRVKEDYICFNINVTTDATNYKAAKVGSRMRCIVTTVDTAAPGAGGVAYLNSFAYAGKVFSKDIPCWCFNPTVKSIADTISHECGHTFGLRHDGLVGRAEYYFGQGAGATSWGPIMGAPFTKSVSQWSRGEYKGANNYEFDIEIIANRYNGFGYAPDDFGDTPATAGKLTLIPGTQDIEQRGVIDKPRDLDVFAFTSQRGGTLLVSASGIGNQVGNLDVQLDVLNGAGVQIGTNKFDRSIGAGLNVVIAPGINYIRIRGAGDGDVDTTGYSAYGSRGAYTITGRLPQ